MQTALREVYGFGIGELTHLKCLHTVEKGTGRILGEWIHVGHETRGTGGIPFLARGDTGMTAHADIKIDYQG
jgi:hypothetical protein